MNTQEKLADIQRQLDEVKREIEAPELKQIDWSSVKAGTLVLVWDEDSGRKITERYLRYREDKQYKHRTSSVNWKHASLETGRWIFNHSGENPWPKGVMVELWFRDGDKAAGGIYRPYRFRWSQSGKDSDIIASRCIGLEEGWRW